MALVIMIASRKDIMGHRFVNSTLSTILGWIIVIIMSLAGSALLFSLVTGK